jgi:acetolactate synthase regulatory subunit
VCLHILLKGVARRSVALIGVVPRRMAFAVVALTGVAFKDVAIVDIPLVVAVLRRVTLLGVALGGGAAPMDVAP